MDDSRKRKVSPFGWVCLMMIPGMLVAHKMHTQVTQERVIAEKYMERNLQLTREYAEKEHELRVALEEEKNKHEAAPKKKWKKPVEGSKRGTDSATYNYWVIGRVARTFGVDEALMKALCKQESYGCHHVHKGEVVTSAVGAKGMMQVMPTTGRRMLKGYKNGDKASNLVASAKYIAMLQERYKGNVVKIAAAYNAGEGAVDKYHGVPPYKETRNYVKKVAKYYVEFKRG